MPRLRTLSDVAGFSKLYTFICTYSADDRTAYAADGEVDWPVIWLLARHNRKHIFSNGAQPGVADV